MIWPLTLGEVLVSAGRKFPDRVALIGDDEEMIYSQLDEASTRFARGLVARGVRHGDRVAVMLPATTSFIVAFYGAVKAGAVATLINEQLKPDEVATLLGHCRPRVFLVGDPTEDLLRAAADVDQVVDVATGSKSSTALKPILEAADDETGLPRVIDQDWAAILFTSGTTGAPKGAILTHLNLVSSCAGMVSVFGYGERDRGLSFLPAATIFATWMHICHFMVGASLVMQRKFSRRDAIDALKRHRITSICAVPSILIALANEKDFSQDAVEDLTCVVSGGAAFPSSLWSRLLEILPEGTGLFDAYGQTETAGASVVCDRTTAHDAPGIIGRPVPYIRLRIMDENGHALADGEIGEVAIQGSKVMHGYLDNEEATAEALRDGHYWTGDLARMDADGMVYLVGRKKDFIIRGGMNVYPQEIEHVLTMHPGVEDAAVLGVPDPFYGEIVKAVVVPAGGHEPDEARLSEWCSQKLADYKVPGEIDFREELPRNDGGKVIKHLLA